MSKKDATARREIDRLMSEIQENYKQIAELALVYNLPDVRATGPDGWHTATVVTESWRAAHGWESSEGEFETEFKNGDWISSTALC